MVKLPPLLPLPIICACAKPKQSKYRLSDDDNDNDRSSNERNRHNKYSNGIISDVQPVRFIYTTCDCTNKKLGIYSENNFSNGFCFHAQTTTLCENDYDDWIDCNA